MTLETCIYEDSHSKCCHQMLNPVILWKVGFYFCPLIKSLCLSAAVVHGDAIVIIKAWWHCLTGTATDGLLHGSYNACRSLHSGLFLERRKHERQSLGGRLLIIWMWVRDFCKCMRWLNAVAAWLFPKLVIHSSAWAYICLKQVYTSWKTHLIWLHYLSVIILCHHISGWKSLALKSLDTYHSLILVHN